MQLNTILAAMFGLIRCIICVGVQQRFLNGTYTYNMTSNDYLKSLHTCNEFNPIKGHMYMYNMYLPT